MKPIYRNPLPVGWREKPLKDVTVRRRGYSWGKSQETTVPEDGVTPVIRIPNVREALNLTDLLYLRNVPAKALETSGVTRDWVLYVGSNGNPERIGDSVLISTDRPMVFASFLQGISTRDPSEILPGFLAQWMRLHSVHQAFSKTSQQTTGLANLSWSAVKRLPLRHPVDIEEQQGILTALSDVQDAITAAQQHLLAAQRVKTALMQQLFTTGIPGRHRDFRRIKRGVMPASWQMTSISRIADVGSGVTLNQDRSPRSNGHRYLTVVNVQRDRIDLTEERYLELWPSEVPSRLLEKGDILVVEGHASSSEIGRAAMVDEQTERLTFQNHLFQIRVNTDEVIPAFMLHSLNCERVRRHWNAICNTSSGLNTINRRQLRRLEIPKPPHPEQEEIVALIEASKATIRSCEGKLNALRTLKKSLLQYLLTGRVRVNIEAEA